jgi:membrane protease YdiL (CAAX protease family)
MFLGLTFALSAALWSSIVVGAAGTAGPAYILALMWCPGVSALATRRAFRSSARGGWRPGAVRWLGMAAVLPLVYGLVSYGLVWSSPFGDVDLGRFQSSVVAFLILGSLQNLVSATGEEIGWRGFLVPMLARTMSFGQTALVSGGIWAAWHVPLIVLADYNAGTPAWFAVPCFVIGAVSVSFPLAWLRLRSGSVWPAVFLHAAHNLFVQGFFDAVTVDTGPTRWLTGEFGAVFAAALVLTAWLFWRSGIEPTS